MRVIGYLRASIDAPLAAVSTLDEQRSAIERWARAHHHELLEVVSDVGRTAATRLGRRAALAGALGAIRDERADAIVVASLDRLSTDVIEQELLRAELVRRGGLLCSTKRTEMRALDEPGDERALVRRVIEQAATFDGTLRDLHVLHRVRSHAAGTEREHAVMARIEELAERGASEDEIASNVGPLGGRVRSLMARMRGDEAAGRA